MISCLGVFACLIFLTVIYYLKHISNLKNIDWDVQTITAGDYTVEMGISPEAYKKFLVGYFEVHDRASGLSTGESFKAYLNKEIERILTKFLREHGDGGVHDNEHTNQLTEVKIADIIFAFNN